MNKIIVTQTTDGYRAHVENRPEIWECGQTENEAIGKLVGDHSDIFGIQVVSE